MLHFVISWHWTGMSNTINKIIFEFVLQIADAPQYLPLTRFIATAAIKWIKSFTRVWHDDCYFASISMKSTENTDGVNQLFASSFIYYQIGFCCRAMLTFSWESFNVSVTSHNVFIHNGTILPEWMRHEVHTPLNHVSRWSVYFMSLSDVRGIDWKGKPHFDTCWKSKKNTWSKWLL